MTTILLDPVTLQFCADLARNAAAGIPVKQAHHACVVAALVVLAEEIDAISRALQGRDPVR